MNDSLTTGTSIGLGSDEIIFPFSITIDPMERLLLVNFEKDPDAIYIGFEPQVFHDAINGSGHLVIGWRRDKKVDVYHQKSLHVQAAKYQIAGAGVNQMIPVEMHKCFFEVNAFGVQAQYQFMDIAGRKVEISIREANQRSRKPFGLLAPMGDAATHPSAFPLVLLHDFYFVRKNKTAITVSINKKAHQVDSLPMPIDGQKMTFARYSPRPLIASFNPNFTGQLGGLKALVGQKIVEKDDCSYEIEWTGQKAFIKSMQIKNNVYLLSMQFNPSFPDLNRLQSHTQLEGKFTISGHPSVGSISGNYSMQADADSFAIRLVPSGGWKPKTSKFSTWFLFTVAKIFKKWPTTYQWDAKLKRKAQGLWHMDSKWIRTRRISND